MAIGLRFRSSGSNKAARPGSRAASRARKGPQRDQGLSRRQQASQWERGQSTLGPGAKPKSSLFFGPANVGKSKAAAPVSAMDMLTGRGSYMDKLRKERKKIVSDYMKEKSKMLAKQRKYTAEVRRDLRRHDDDIYKEYHISPSMRPSAKKGAQIDKRKQKQLARRAGQKVMSQVRAAQRKQLRELRKGRDANIKKMVKELRESGG